LVAQVLTAAVMVLLPGLETPTMVAPVLCPTLALIGMDADPILFGIIKLPHVIHFLALQFCSEFEARAEESC